MPFTYFAYSLFAGYLLSWVLCGIFLWHGFRRKRDMALSFELFLPGLCILATFILVCLMMTGRQLRAAGSENSDLFIGLLVT